MTLIEPSQPSVGELLKAFRHTHQATLPEVARRLGLPLVKIRALENDETLPDSDDVISLAMLLDIPTHHMLRATNRTAMHLLVAAVERARSGEKVPLPRPLQRAVARAMHVDPSDTAAFMPAWETLVQEPPASRSMRLMAAVAQLWLDGENEDIRLEDLGWRRIHSRLAASRKSNISSSSHDRPVGVTMYT